MGAHRGRGTLSALRTRRPLISIPVAAAAQYLPSLGPSRSWMIAGGAIFGAVVGATVGAVIDGVRGGSTIVFQRAAALPDTHIGLFTSRGAAGLQVQLRF